MLACAASENCDALATKDANLQYEQNLTSLPLAVVILHAASNDIDDLPPLLPALLAELETLPPKQVTHVS